MTTRHASSTSPERGLEPRPSRMGWLRGIAAVTFVLLAVPVAALPAVANPCHRKGSENAPKEMCRGEGGTTGDRAEDGNRNAHGNGNAHGHDNEDTEGSNSGGNENAGGTGSPAGGTTGPSKHGRKRHRSDHGGSEGTDDGGRRRRSQTTGRQAEASADASSSRLSNVLSSLATDMPIAPNLATDADWDLAGPQLTSGPVEVQEAVARDRELWSTALVAAESLAFPMSLSLLVVLFLIVQAYIDRDDPKLKHAALRKEVYEFS
jgi:hypothetical protein